MKSYTSADI